MTKKIHHLLRVFFQARIGYLGAQFYLGCFATPADAAAAYNEKRKELYGSFAR